LTLIQDDEELHNAAEEEFLLDLTSLKKICGHTAYTFMYTQEVLRQYEATLRANQTLDNATETCNVIQKVRRIRQEVEQVTYVTQGIKMEPFHLLKRHDMVQSYPKLANTILSLHQERKCTDKTSSDLATVYGYKQHKRDVLSEKKTFSSTRR
jgi:hypothetical protein